MHHFKGNVGSGIFALGDAFKNAGLLLAPPLTIFLGFICIHAQHILVSLYIYFNQKDQTIIYFFFSNVFYLSFS